MGHDGYRRQKANMWHGCEKMLWLMASSNHPWSLMYREIPEYIVSDLSCIVEYLIILSLSCHVSWNTWVYCLWVVMYRGIPEYIVSVLSCIVEYLSILSLSCHVSWNTWVYCLWVVIYRGIPEYIVCSIFDEETTNASCRI